jgi:predicted nucleic acid-binding protein
LLVATAAQAGCSIALTEDMADGNRLGGLEPHNPFAATGGLADLARTLLGLS